MTLLQQAADFEAELIEVRRDLHRHPELAFRETRTAGIVADRLATLGLQIQRGVGGTGVVADLANDSGPTVALRADMDALPIAESNEVDYRSTVAGAMHACGHDAHVSMLLGAARLLVTAQRAGTLPAGKVRFLFQPAEEATDADDKSGAVRLIEDGAMRGVDAVFGLHIGAHLPAGPAYLRAGPIMAGSDTFTATVEGVSAHAARPHEGVDAIVLASHAVLACQQGAARRISPFDEGVLTIGTVHGGVAENVIADRVTLRGTIRYFDVRVRERLQDALRRGFAVVDALGGHGVLDLRDGYPAVINDGTMTSLARNAIADALGAAAVADAEPMMGAEDFAFLLREAPGAFFWLGAALEPPREHHHPRFDIDESVLKRGAAALAACALHALREVR
ncbi:MAG: M20 metallopeptidase family protein [Longimicrobiales bacterium]